MLLRGFILLLSISLLCCACSRRSDHEMPDVSVRPDEAFRLFSGIGVDAPLPSGITDLQANGAIWQDFTVCCRFTASAEIISLIISNGYEEVQWEAIKADMSPRDYVGLFHPKWEPESVEEKGCYIRRVEDEHSLEILRLLIDHKSGLVYAVGVGEVF